MDSQIPQPPAQSNPGPIPQPLTQNTPPVTNTPIEPDHASPVIIFLLLLFFPPLAWFFMLKEKRYHKWFAVLVSIYPIILIIILSYLAIFVLPKLTTLNNEIGNNQVNPWMPLLIALIVNIIQIFFGVFLFIKAKSLLPTPKILLIIAIILLLIEPLILGFSIVSIVNSAILPTYNLTTQF